MRVPRLLRIAPLTCLFLSSWACGLLGLALDPSITHGALSSLWASVVAPAYAFALLGAVLGMPFPLWVLATFAVLGLADYGVHLLVRAGREAIGWAAGRVGTQARAAAASLLQQLPR